MRSSLEIEIRKKAVLALAQACEKSLSKQRQTIEVILEGLAEKVSGESKKEE